MEVRQWWERRGAPPSSPRREGNATTHISARRHPLAHAAKGLAVAIMAFLLSMPFGVASSASPAKPSHPPGNNGTVKVDGLPFDQHIDNEPHPGCTFNITFFNYEQLPTLWATATFALISPTRDGSITFGPVFIGADPIGGAKDFDGALEPDLRSFLSTSGVTPQAQQGYHVKLTVHAPGSIGSDVKHKVFWVQCAASPSPSPSPSVLPTSPSPSPS